VLQLQQLPASRPRNRKCCAAFWTGCPSVQLRQSFHAVQVRSAPTSNRLIESWVSRAIANCSNSPGSLERR